MKAMIEERGNVGWRPEPDGRRVASVAADHAPHRLMSRNATEKTRCKNSGGCRNAVRYCDKATVQPTRPTNEDERQVRSMSMTAWRQGRVMTSICSTARPSGRQSRSSARTWPCSPRPAHAAATTAAERPEDLAPRAEAKMVASRTSARGVAHHEQQGRKDYSGDRVLRPVVGLALQIEPGADGRRRVRRASKAAQVPRPRAAR